MNVDFDQREVVQRRNVLFELFLADVGLQEDIRGASLLILVSRDGLVQGFVDLGLIDLHFGFELAPGTWQKIFLDTAFDSEKRDKNYLTALAPTSRSQSVATHLFSRSVLSKLVRFGMLLVRIESKMKTWQVLFEGM